MKERITFIEAIWLVLFLVLLLKYNFTLLCFVIVLFPRWIVLIDNIRTGSAFRKSGMKKEVQDIEKELTDEINGK